MARTSRSRKRNFKEEEEEEEVVAEVSSEQQDEGSSSNSNRHRRKKTRVMQDSGQSDRERQKLRTDLRKLKDEIANTADGDAIEDPTSSAFDTFRNRNNRLFDSVHYNREGVLDSENLELISGRAKKQVSSLVKLPAYDPVRIAHRLRSQATDEITGNFNWSAFGEAAGVCFLTPPHATFFNGPLSMDVEFIQQKQKRKPRQNRKNDHLEEEKLDEEKEKSDADEDGDKLSAVEKHISCIYRTLKSRVKESAEQVVKQKEAEDGKKLSKEEAKKLKSQRSEGGVDAVQFLFNPKSFTQTVENIFHFSFLIKQGKAGIRVDEDEQGRKVPKVRLTKTDAERDPEPRQAILSLNMKQWRKLVKAHHVQKSDIPHRTASKIAKGLSQSK